MSWDWIRQQAAYLDHDIVDVVFESKQLLGLLVCVCSCNRACPRLITVFSHTQLKRANEWAIVRSVDADGVASQKGVTEGSVIHFINGRNVLHETHKTTMEVLANAQWPLRLGLKRPPKICGFLSKHEQGEQVPHHFIRHISGLLA